MTELEELMISYGLDASNPDHMDELLYRICNEDDYIEHDCVEELLSEFSDLNDYYDEYDDSIEDSEWID
tara:strand:- start:250 stop:456 length:207 start_codon:yes stop_codon:yes gene_type:complete